MYFLLYFINLSSCPMTSILVQKHFIQLCISIQHLMLCTIIKCKYNMSSIWIYWNFTFYLQLQFFGHYWTCLKPCNCKKVTYYCKKWVHKPILTTQCFNTINYTTMFCTPTKRCSRFDVSNVSNKNIFSEQQSSDMILVTVLQT